MKNVKNHYELLGLPHNATTEQIKQSYRDLVRKTHPDVASDKASAHRLFIRITEAYDVLSDPIMRRSYDRAVDAEKDRAERDARRIADEEARKRAEQEARMRGQQFAGKFNRRYSTYGPGGPPLRERASKVQNLIRAAQFAFIERRLQTAAKRCLEAIELESTNGMAHATLGDVYRAQGKTSNAIKHYSFAVQFNPKDRETHRKLNDLMSRHMEVEQRRGHDNITSYYRTRLSLVGWPLVVALILLIKVFPGSPLDLDAQHAALSWNLVAFMAAAGVLSGFLMGANGILANPMRELFSTTIVANCIPVPVGGLMLLASLASFWTAAIVYIVVTYLRRNLSTSVIAAYGVSLGIMLLSVIMGAKMEIVKLEGNVIFPAVALGWMLCHIIDPIGRLGKTK